MRRIRDKFQVVDRPHRPGGPTTARAARVGMTGEEARSGKTSDRASLLLYAAGRHPARPHIFNFSLAEYKTQVGCRP